VAGADVATAVIGRRQCVWDDSAPVETSVYDYGAIQAGHMIAGPAVIEADDTTILIAPGWRGAMDEYGFFRIHQEGTR
jgi:N-methylhydantoinase A